jgi:hypothetical protein
MTDELIYWVLRWFTTPVSPDPASMTGLELISLAIRFGGTLVAWVSLVDCWRWDLKGAMESGSNGTRLLLAVDRFIGCILVLVTQLLLVGSVLAAATIRDGTLDTMSWVGLVFADVISVMWLSKGYLTRKARYRLHTERWPRETDAEGEGGVG